MVRTKKAQALMPEEKTPVRKKTDGRTAEGKLQKLNADYARIKADYNELCKQYASLKVQEETMIEAVRSLEMLLASFNALTRKGDVKLTKPAEGTPYWYIRAMAPIKSFEVVPCQWNDWKGDHYRYVKGNMFLDQKTANMACTALNVMLNEL